MASGEGKSTVTVLVAAMNALFDQEALVVIVTENISCRDAKLTGQVFRYHGFLVELNQGYMELR